MKKHFSLRTKRLLVACLALMLLLGNSLSTMAAAGDAVETASSGESLPGGVFPLRLIRASL